MDWIWLVYLFNCLSISYGRRKWNRWPEFKSWTRLFAFHFVLIPWIREIFPSLSIEVCLFLGIYCCPGNLSYLYLPFSMYIYIYNDRFPDFFSNGHFYWQYIHETLVPFEVISSGCNALVVPFQQLPEGLMELLMCERVNELCHNLFHLLNFLITTASELKE